MKLLKNHSFTKLLTTLVILLSILICNVFAANLTYWYADADMDIATMVMYQTKSYYSYSNLSNNSETNTRLISEIANAASGWKSKLGISLSANSSNASSSNGFVIYCGTSSALANAGISLSSNLSGYTNITDKYAIVDSLTYSSGTATICKFTATIPVYVKTDVGTTANTIAHEMGHALGWYGHNLTYSSMLMNKYSSTVTSPTTRDGNHLKQIYDLYR